MNTLFADTLRNLRAKKGLSQNQLANLMFVNNTTISKWESGSRLPDAAMIARLARVLEVDVGTSHGPCPERGDRAWAWGSRGSERGPGFRLWHRQRSQRRRPGCPLGLSFWLSCSWYGIYLSFISRLGSFSLFT